MKTIVLRIITLIVLLTSVSALSQNWQPIKTSINNEDGIFLPFRLMDTISFKLIERKSLLGQNLSFGELFKVLQDKNDELVDKTLNLSVNSCSL